MLTLILEIFSIDDSRKVEHLGSLINLGPKALLEQFFGLAQVLCRLELIEVGKNTHDLWESVRLQYVQKLKRFHFKAKFGIDTKQDQVSNLGAVEHRRGVVAGALQKGDALVLGGYDGDWTGNGCKIVICVKFDERTGSL